MPNHKFIYGFSLSGLKVSYLLRDVNVFHLIPCKVVGKEGYCIILNYGEIIIQFLLIFFIILQFLSVNVEKYFHILPNLHEPSN